MLGAVSRLHASMDCTGRALKGMVYVGVDERRRNGVLGMTELALATALSDEQRAFVSTIQTSGEALLRVINDILDFSKVEAGKLSIETADVDVRAVVAECAELLGPRAAEKGIAFAYLVSPKVPGIVVGDGLRTVSTLWHNSRAGRW